MATARRYQTTINAPASRVWDTFLSHGSYEEWAAVFAPDSTFDGNWAVGEEVKFCDSSGAGLIAEIKELRPAEYIRMEYVGALDDGGAEHRESAPWLGNREAYRLEEREGSTVVTIEMDSTEDDGEFAEMMDDGWPRALEILKGLAERPATGAA